MSSRSTRTKHRVALYFSIQLQQPSARTFLLKPHQVTRRVAESGNPACASRRVSGCAASTTAPPSAAARFNVASNALDPDVGQRAWFARNLSTCSERAADVSCRVIDARMSTVAVPNIPADHFLVESNRLANVGRGNLQIAQPGARQQRQPALALGHFGSACVRSQIPRVLREKPNGDHPGLLPHIAARHSRSR